MSKELFYLDDKIIVDEAKSILSLGEKIKFLETILETNQYRIIAKSHRADALAQIIEEKWIKNRLDEELEEMKETAIQEVQLKYRKEKQKNRTLTDF